MTTIDHQQAAVLAGAEALWKADPTCFGVPAPKTSDEWAYETIGYTHEAQAALTAAAPHLRAAWEQPIRELCEAAIKRANDPLAARGIYGETFPATVYAQDILDLLEGGGEDK